MLTEDKEKFREVIFSSFPINQTEEFLDFYIQEVNELWEQFEPYSHSDFKKQVNNNPSKIHAFRFEMEVGLHLKSIGMNLQCTPNGDGMPDLLIVENGKKLWIECCQPQRGDNPSKNVPERGALQIHGSAINQSLLRITNALSNKGTQHNKCITSGKVSEGGSYIIALDGYFLELNELFDKFRQLPLVCEAFLPYTEINEKIE